MSATTRTRDSDGVCVIGALQGALGLALLAYPQARALVGVGIAPTPTWVVRLLGGRLLAQAIVELVYRTPRAALGGAAMDATHALSMVALAAGSRRHRRPALRSAVVATASAAALAAAGRAASPAATLSATR